MCKGLVDHYSLCFLSVACNNIFNCKFCRHSDSEEVREESIIYQSFSMVDITFPLEPLLIFHVKIAFL